jgi:hypothetical protein
MGVSIIDELPALRAGQTGFGLVVIIGSRFTTVDAPAGVYAVLNGDGKVKLPVTAAEIALGTGGILENLADRVSNSTTTGLEYDADDFVRYVEEGIGVMITEDATTDGQAVFIRHTANGAGKLQLGVARSDEDGDVAETVEITVVSSADLIEIEFEINGEIITYLSGSTETTTQKATALAAQIDALTDYGATSAAAVVTVTPTSGSAVLGEIAVVDIATFALGTDSDPKTAELLPNAYFVGDAVAGLAKVRIR